MHNILSMRWTEGWGGVAHFVLRVATGLVFFMHGYQKLTAMGVAGVSGFLGSLGFPAPDLFAVVLIGVELIGGAALVLGVFTRQAAALTLIVSIVAFLTVHVSKGFFISDGGYEFIVLLAAASFALMVEGPGRYSAERLLRG